MGNNFLDNWQEIQSGDNFQRGPADLVSLNSTKIHINLHPAGESLR